MSYVQPVLISLRVAIYDFECIEEIRNIFVSVSSNIAILISMEIATSYLCSHIQMFLQYESPPIKIVYHKLSSVLRTQVWQYPIISNDSLSRWFRIWSYHPNPGIRSIDWRT